MSHCGILIQTHFKTSINEAHTRAGKVKSPLNLSDGTFHVGPTQSFGEVGKGEGHNENLEEKLQSKENQLKSEKHCKQ